MVLYSSFTTRPAAICLADMAKPPLSETKDKAETLSTDPVPSCWMIKLNYHAFGLCLNINYNIVMARNDVNSCGIWQSLHVPSRSSSSWGAIGDPVMTLTMFTALQSSEFESSTFVRGQSFPRSNSDWWRSACPRDSFTISLDQNANWTKTRSACHPCRWAINPRQKAQSTVSGASTVEALRRLFELFVPTSIDNNVTLEFG